jgi:hypothetical protein
MSFSYQDRFHVVYAVTSVSNDYYSAMTRVSITSLRHFNPQCHVTIALDSESLENLSSKKDPLLNEADSVLEVSTPEGCPQFRNRFVKTSLTNHIAGPFLFMDSDTLVRSDVSEIFRPIADIQGCLNHSHVNPTWQINKSDIHTLALMNWATWKSQYINGGLIYYSGSEKSHNLGKLWHSNWLASFSKTGSPKDQPALNAALASLNPSFNLLPIRFNAQIKINSLCALNAVIWHYYSSFDSPPITHVEALINQASNGFSSFKDDVVRIAKMETPWIRCDSFIGSYFLKSLNTKSHIDQCTLKYLEGSYFASGVLLIPKIFYCILDKIKYRLNLMSNTIRRATKY